MKSRELELVEWLRTNSPQTRAVMEGIGDDMAVVNPFLLDSKKTDQAATPILISSDMLLDGVHFDTKCHDMALIGRKAIACSLSDCAAMAVRPVAATVSLAIPEDHPLARIQEIYRGMWSIAAEYDLAIVGGDTTRWHNADADSRLVIDVAIVAAPFDGIAPVRRGGAQIGDAILVTGRLGGSLSGRHLTFTPRVREAKSLAQSLGPRLHAMMDISDGLSLDLWRLCQTSGVGALLDETQLQHVAHPDAAKTAAQDGLPVLDHVLSDGEDFELLFTASASESEIDSHSIGSIPVHCVGRICESGFRIRRTIGTIESLEPRGYVH